MKNKILITCEKCKEEKSGIPVLSCGHFYCAACYCELKSQCRTKFCGCPSCGKNMRRKGM